MAVIPGVENINWLGATGSIVTVLTYIILLTIVAVVFFAFYWYLSFPIKATVIEVYGSGKNGQLSYGKYKTNKFKWVKKKTAWKPLFPLMNKIEIEPFNDEFIYPGKRIIAYKYGETYYPGRLNVTGEAEGAITGSMNPVPYSVRNWQSLAHKRNREEFSELTFFQQNKYFVAVILTVLICCITCAVTVWLTYKFAGAGAANMQALTDAIRGVGVIPGK